MTQEEINIEISKKIAQTSEQKFGELTRRVIELEAANIVLTERYTAVVQELNEYKSVPTVVEKDEPMEDIVIPTENTNKKKERTKDGD